LQGLNGKFLRKKAKNGGLCRIFEAKQRPPAQKYAAAREELAF
jgi:hypothetical protein